MRGRGNPRHRLDVAPRQIEGTPGLALRRHSGEGRNPEPGRAAANGRSRPIHARVHGFAGAVREAHVLTAWVDNPAIVRSVGGAGRSRTTPTRWLRIDGVKMRRRGNPRRRLDVVPCQIKGTPGLAFRRHSGEGRNPEPGRAAANGRSRPIHARGLCFRRGGARTARFDGMGRQPGDCPFGRRGGSFTNDPYGMFAWRRDGDAAEDNHRGLSLRD